jgi:predicted nucleic acid-binding protein
MMTVRGRKETFFCDTSVLVAASDAAHQHHVPSQAIIARATPPTAFCAAHALAELYSTLSGGRYLRVLPLDQVLRIVTRVQTIFTIIDVPQKEYMRLLDSAVRLQIRGGRVYDALQIQAATLCDAQVIYTWNDTDFRAVAPPLIAARVRTPASAH